MTRSIEKKVAVRKQTLRTLASADLRRVAGGMVVADLGGVTAFAEPVYDVCWIAASCA